MPLSSAGAAPQPPQRFAAPMRVFTAVSCTSPVDPGVCPPRVFLTTPCIYYRFPLLFPLRNPTYLPAGCTMEVHLSRNIGNGKVWYEWAVTAPSVGAVNNVNGRSFSIGL